jgi:hypothetical protein
MSMSKSDTAKLLAFCAAYDQRTIGKSDVEAWTEALDSPWVPNVALDEAQAAVVAHYRETPQRVTVADVLKRVKAERADRLGRGIPIRQQGCPPTEEYLRARAALNVKLSAEKPEGAA